MPSLIDSQRDSILQIAAKHGASNLRIFGSMARGTADDESDVDILVDLEAGRSLLDQVALKQDLEELLGRCVGVLVEGGISPYLEQQIKSEATPL